MFIATTNNLSLHAPEAPRLNNIFRHFGGFSIKEESVESFENKIFSGDSLLNQQGIKRISGLQPKETITPISM